jgi:16S rRNA (cytosine1402-N4)-methyltransferase
VQDLSCHRRPGQSELSTAKPVETIGLGISPRSNGSVCLQQTDITDRLALTPQPSPFTIPRVSTPLPPSGHEPVLLKPVLEWLDPKPGQTVVDCTVGRGGHSEAIVDRLWPNGILIGLDYDPKNLDYASSRLAGKTIRLFHANFAEISDALEDAEIGPVDGILADLGISTNQLFDTSYGLSLARDADLDMRLDPRNRLTAKQIVNTWPEQKIADTLYQLADERFSRRIARKIVETRRLSPIKTTEALADLVRGVVPPPKNRRPGEIDTATRTFMALRMAVNDEMGNLERFLKTAPTLLKPGGRLAVISFHSTEDRLVKQTFRMLAQTGRVKILTNRPIVPDEAEITENPRSRSAKLRVIETIRP